MMFQDNKSFEFYVKCQKLNCLNIRGQIYSIPSRFLFKYGQHIALISLMLNDMSAVTLCSKNPNLEQCHMSGHG